MLGLLIWYIDEDDAEAELEDEDKLEHDNEDEGGLDVRLRDGVPVAVDDEDEVASWGEGEPLSPLLWADLDVPRWWVQKKERTCFIS